MKITLLLWTAFLLLSGCSSTPPLALKEAQDSLREAKSDPFVVQNAPLALAEAERSVDHAEEKWRETKDREDTERLALKARNDIEDAKLLAGKHATAEVSKEARLKDDLLQRERAFSDIQQRELDNRAQRERVLLNELQAVQTRELEREILVSLNSDVLFDTGRADLKPGAERELAPLITFLANHSSHGVRIEGHTDNAGDADYNQSLSKRRAEAVESYLITRGVPRRSITSVGLGEVFPIASNDTQAGRLQNRRVEVVILPETH